MIIDKFTVHILDINMEKPMLTDFVGKNFFDVDKFLKKLIKKHKKSNETMKAKWKDYDTTVKNCCNAILENEESFIECSKEIAAYYYHLMKEHNKTNEVTLVICKYIEDDGYNSIAIIKLENKITYNTSIDYINEKFNVNIIENTKTLSTSLKQSAVIHEKDLACMFDLTILEKEDKKQSVFIKNFLGADLIRDDTYKTKVFIDLASMFIDVSFGEEMEKKEKAINLLHNMLDRTSNMDINKFIIRSGIDGDLQGTLKKYDIVNSFNIDKKIVEKEFTQRSIKTDTGFSIKGKVSAFEDESKYKLISNENGTTDLVIKNIKYFKEV